MLQGKRKLVVISAYAPTNPVCEKKNQIRETFYDELEAVIKTVSKRSILLVAGDYNAKTKVAVTEGTPATWDSLKKAS